MSVRISDIVYVKSNIVNQTLANGGGMSSNVIANRTLNGFLPIASPTQYTSGVTLYSKEFVWNKNTSNKTAYSVLYSLFFTTTSGDKFLGCVGTQTDTQAEADDYTTWRGAGRLDSMIIAGATSLSILFPSTEFAVVNGDIIIIDSNFMLSQAIASDVTVFDAVWFDGSEWVRMTAPSIDPDEYLYGTYMGNNVVYSINSSGHLEYLTVSSSSWVNNVCTINTVETIVNNYPSSYTYAGVCLTLGDIKTSYSDVVETSAGDGTFVEANMVLGNVGTIEDTWTLTFTSATAYNVSGTLTGALAAGATSGSYAPNNPAVTAPYFTIGTNCWAATWASGDTVVFKTHPASASIWIKQIIPAGMAEPTEPDGFVGQLFLQ